jgi:anti-anti-sigma regulatory factor
LVLIETFADIGEELERQFLALLIDLRQVDDSGTLGFRHFGWLLKVWWGVFNTEDIIFTIAHR